MLIGSRLPQGSFYPYPAVFANVAYRVPSKFQVERDAGADAFGVNGNFLAKGRRSVVFGRDIEPGFGDLHAIEPRRNAGRVGPLAGAGGGMGMLNIVIPFESVVPDAVSICSPAALRNGSGTIQPWPGPARDRCALPCTGATSGPVANPARP